MKWLLEGVIKYILDHLIELKEKQKYCQEDLNNEFEDLIFKWKRSLSL